MKLRTSLAACGSALAIFGAVAAAASGQTVPEGILVPPNAVAIEGTPVVRVDATEDHVARQLLTEREVAQNRLRIRVENGRYFWASRGNRPLTLTSSGEFIYLESSEPGQYVRFRRVNDRLSSVEHVDMAQGSVTYWGELRIILGK
jgi:hypothetical protein